MASIAERNVRLFLAFRGTTRALLFAPYIFFFMTGLRGLSFTEYGLLQLVYYWIVMAAEVPSGIVADRLGRRTTLIIGAIANALGCYVFALSYSFPAFATGEVLFALGTALISGADSALLYDSLAAENRQAEYARAEGRGQAVWLLVTGLGMPLTDLFLVRGDDPVLAYWFTGSLCLLGCAAAWAMVEPPVGKRLSTREITVGAVRDVVHRPAALRIVLYSIGVFILLRAAIVLFFNPVLGASGVPVDRFGTVLAAVNIVGAVAAFEAHRILDRFGERAFVLAMPLSLLAMFALLGAVRVPAVAALFCIQGAIFGAYPLVVRTILNRHVASAARRATVLSLESMACRVVFGVVVALLGHALDRMALATVIWLAAATACVPFLLLPLVGGRDSSDTAQAAD